MIVAGQNDPKRNRYGTSVKSLIDDINRIPVITRYGRVISVQGLLVEVAGIQSEVSIGSRCVIETRRSVDVTAEVVGFRDDHALLMPFRELEGVGLGCRVVIGDTEPVVYPNRGWLGRVVNGFGEPIDGKGPLPRGRRLCTARLAAART